jgi:hypothetical protein
MGMPRKIERARKPAKSKSKAHETPEKPKVKAEQVSPGRSRLAGPVMDLSAPLPDPKEFVSPQCLELFKQVTVVLERLCLILEYPRVSRRNYSILALLLRQPKRTDRARPKGSPRPCEDQNQ